MKAFAVIFVIFFMWLGLNFLNAYQYANLTEDQKKELATQNQIKEDQKKLKTQQQEQADATLYAEQKSIADIPFNELKPPQYYRWFTAYTYINIQWFVAAGIVLAIAKLLLTFRNHMIDNDSRY